METRTTKWFARIKASSVSIILLLKKFNIFTYHSL